MSRFPRKRSNYVAEDVKGQDTAIHEVAVRKGAKDDVPFLFKRTLRDFRNAPLVHGMPDGLYHQYMHRALEHTFTRAVVLIAYPSPKILKMDGSNVVRSSDTSKILGFIVADPTEVGLIVHYVNTRVSYDESGRLYEDYRRQGIATKLLDTMIDQFKLREDRIYWTMRTPMFRYERDFRKKIQKDKRFVYNPFLFFTLLPEGWETGIRTPQQAHFARISN